LREVAGRPKYAAMSAVDQQDGGATDGAPRPNNLVGVGLLAAWIALGATIVLLSVYSYLAGVRSGLGTGGRIASAAAGAGIGLLVALLKVALH